MYRDVTTDSAVLSPCSKTICDSSAAAPISCKAGMSTLIVLLPGQYDAGLVAFASEQFADSVLSVGGLAGLNVVSKNSINVDKVSSSIWTWPVSTLPSRVDLQRRGYVAATLFDLVLVDPGARRGADVEARSGRR